MADELPAAPLAPSPPAHLSRSGRRIKVPIARWTDVQPSSMAGLPSQITNAFPARLPSPPPPPPPDVAPPSPVAASSSNEAVWELPQDQFGVFRRYPMPQLPRRDPEERLTAVELCAAVELAQEERPDPAEYPSIRWLARSVASELPKNPHEPFETVSSYVLCNWWYNSARTKSLQDLQKLATDLRTPGFSLDDLETFNARREMKRLDNYKKQTGIFSEAAGWHETTLHLPTPYPGEKFASEADTPQFPVKGLQFRRLLEVIIAEIQDPRFAEKRHWFPHERYWNPPSAPSSSDSTQAHPASPPPPPEPIRIVTDTFNTEEMLKVQEEIRNMPRDPDDASDVEYCAVPLLLYSDSTRLANFGSASLWPVYLYIGNISKYLRSTPSSFAAQHVAYIPKVSIYCDLS